MVFFIRRRAIFNAHHDAILAPFKAGRAATPPDGTAPPKRR